MDAHSQSGPAWYVVSLRPRGEHDGLRRAAQARGAGLIALSPWAVQPRDDRATRETLQRALACDVVIATSVAAVRAAHVLHPLAPASTRWVAVGSSTAQALREAGVVDVDVPVWMDSEGVLALPALQRGYARTAGVLTAPGGRDVLLPALAARGIEGVRADVYARVDIALDDDALDRLRALDAPAALALSSGGALTRVLSQLDVVLAQRLRTMQVLAASARLADVARAQGFDDIAIAASARPADLLAVARVPG